MIRLVKGPKPQILEDKAAEWTKDLLDTLNAGGDPTPTQLNRYRHQDVKDALKLETHKKCAYCESLPLHVTYGDVEHILPKSLNPALAFDWNNLTLACSVCNNGKRARDDLIDPYQDDLPVEFSFLGPMIVFLPGRNKAERTIEYIDLNRVELLERRYERLKGLRNILNRLQNEPDVQQREFIIEVITKRETADKTEYAACVRKCVEDLQASGLI